jgi:hypothetical protein
MYPISKPMIAIISVFLQFTSLLVHHLHNLPSPQQHDPAKSCEKEVKEKHPDFHMKLIEKPIPNLSTFMHSSCTKVLHSDMRTASVFTYNTKTLDFPF